MTAWGSRVYNDKTMKIMDSTCHETSQVKGAPRRTEADARYAQSPKNIALKGETFLV